MTVQLERPVVHSVVEREEPSKGDFDLDITIVEGGPAADQLIRLTNDGCGTTCQSACTSCP
ncbi:FxLD family lantipeptide [Streptomyces luteolifulvus]|jgi:FxLD family lantipeptide|uniref:FxLD family lantipeptide n=1 Tax=Streptomyces luteolifulvus TaxID=2615112 RepID=A0A6H9UQ42_9ACTN|nr:FxLD family lanthipeptide [Streptomyces luteolifulvus]KAB1140226.1 FxLD family lantipeptide [Streptomyces luteolifulvus]